MQLQEPKIKTKIFVQIKNLRFYTTTSIRCTTLNILSLTYGHNRDDLIILNT